MKQKNLSFTKRLGQFSLFLFFLGILINCKVFAGTPAGFEANKPLLMKKAVPVWAEGREKEMNLTLGFCGVFHANRIQNCTLNITASTLYRVFLNGKFLGYGPARAGHGYFRVDEYDLGKMVRNGENIVAVEISGYNVNSYYTLDQPSFLQAEVQSGGNIVLATGSIPGLIFRVLSGQKFAAWSHPGSFFILMNY